MSDRVPRDEVVRIARRYLDCTNGDVREMAVGILLRHGPTAWVFCGGCQRRGECPIPTCTNHKDAPR